MKAIRQTTGLRDLWTTSQEYRDLYQSSDEVEAVVRQLEMEGATALLDIGCGNGAFAIAAARANPRCRVWAFDALQSAVDVCRGSAARELRGDGRQVVTAVAGAEKIPLADGSADRVLCRSVLHHLADPHAFYRQAARVLRCDGLLLLQAPCNYWGEPWGAFMSDLYALGDDSHRRHYHRPAEVIDGLGAAGLAMRAAHCWPYAWPKLTDAEVDFVRRHGAEERVKLRREGDGTWSCALYWLRVLAVKL